MDRPASPPTTWKYNTRHSSHRAWTIATQRYTASSTACFSAYNLQAIQNATARLITGVQRKDHITPILRQRQLQWLPVREWVIFKHALLVFKALHGLLPPYLADDCQLLADTRRRQLRSSDVAACSVLWTHSSLGDRRSLFRCGWTENMEQFAYQIATTRPQPWTI